VSTILNTLRTIKDKVLRTNYRSSIDGKYVTKSYAQEHPDTTYRERRWLG
jgi:hypothetical protein